jgi:hypothetical protein
MRSPPPDTRRGPGGRTRATERQITDQSSLLSRDDTAGPVQPSLFDRPRIGHAGQEPPRHRSRDPETSRAAASSLDPGRLRAQCRDVLDVLRRAGCQGATRDEVFDALDWRGDRSVLSRRITDLVQGGLALDIGRTRTGVSGRQLTVWGARGACGGRVA